MRRGLLGFVLSGSDSLTSCRLIETAGGERSLWLISNVSISPVSVCHSISTEVGNVCKTNRLHPRIKESETREERQRRSSRVFNVDLVTHSTRCVFPTTTFSKEDTECVVAAQKQSHCVVAVCNYCLLRPVPVCLSGCFSWLSRPSVGTPVIICASLWTDLSIEAVPGAAAVSVPVSPAAAAVSVQPGEGATEPTAQR